MSISFPLGVIRETAHRGEDDLLSAGLGLAGLRALPAPFADAARPTPAEMRRRAIQTAWLGIADLGPLGGYGSIYGAVPKVDGREYQAFARIAGATQPHRVLAQIPDGFDASTRCLIVTASSGSRGIYGAIAFAGAWGLAHRCAVAYTDKGAGSGYFDTPSDSGVALDGTRAERGAVELEFEPAGYCGDAGIAIKHAHSTDNPEAHWGEHLLQAAQFGLAMLDRAFPQQAPFTPQNTRIIAAGLSNGGAAVLQAAGIDAAGWLAGAVAVEPNVYASKVEGSHARPLYDYASEAALLAPCALLDARFDAVRGALAKLPGNNIATWATRAATLREAGILDTGDPRDALARLHAGGWEDAALATAASTTAYDMWRAFGATYASAYTRSAVGAMPGGFRFSALGTDFKPRAATATERAAWWSDASGIPPGNGVFITETTPGNGADPHWKGLAGLRGLWSGSDDAAQRLRASVQTTLARLPRAELPIFLVHGAEDGLIPAVFSSDAYLAWLHANARDAAYWRVPHAQHFDSFLAWPGFGERYVPMLAYAYAALEKMYAHVVHGKPLDAGTTPAAQPRGVGKLETKHLALPL
ncbi:3-hydroxybutyrate oligomer hydrolase family protein [Rudaea cellulosilytica]|uniref:3-hydroxybutyrate oligomer hydrolase family protein n=1 Tax=Rudaea cellulosilytica TaxID=540746 RepID=UPI0003622830|nr:3-hydroxybutyrate oligomer hydrolase family protein [Rudaea cellulosilytica]